MPVSGANDTINLDAGITYAPKFAGDVTHNLTIQTDPVQLAASPLAKAATISGGSIAGPSTLDLGGFVDPLVAGPGAVLTVHIVQFTGAGGLGPSNGDIVVMGPPAGGGSGGTLNLDHSLISSNSANGIDVMSGGTATINNSTITQANGSDGVALSGTASFNEDTIANNADNGIDQGGGGTATVFNTILSNNGLGNCFNSSGLTGSNNDDSGTSCGATITTGGASSTGSGTGFIAANAASNGGPTQTYALPAGSVAIGHGTGGVPAADDQRGWLRDASPDIGAYEAGATQPASLSVIEHVHSGPALPSAFNINITGATANPSSFTGQDSPGTQVTIASGTAFTVGVSGATAANYNNVQTGNCGTAIAAGGTGTCTITSDAKPTTLTVKKIVDDTGNSGTPAQSSDFLMTVTDTSTTPNTVLSSANGSSTGTQVQVPFGHNYTVTESGTKTSQYTESDSAGCTGTASAANGTASCTITNTYIQCTQPTNKGPQPTPGSPGSSANTCVNESVLGTILVTAPISITFPNLPATASATVTPAQAVNVKSNDGAGYQLSVTRTQFTNTPGNDLELALSLASAPSPAIFDPAFAGATPTDIPVSPTNLSIGQTSGAITTSAGDNWAFSYVLTVPFGVPTGLHQSTITFTGIGR